MPDLRGIIASSRRMSGPAGVALHALDHLLTPSAAVTTS